MGNLNCCYTHQERQPFFRWIQDITIILVLSRAFVCQANQNANSDNVTLFEIHPQDPIMRDGVFAVLLYGRDVFRGHMSHKATVI
ncbi:hypothetical protein T05_14611 [Trichinella murrelli]|uniref:Uncharacterized protein n=1 Tax=Trichinella murrelli TaxID=144512 RepID=A0A0V0TAY1_9BILA|nr:hypothetical protein T05_14611 [Trichinella murrelli]